MSEPIVSVHRNTITIIEDGVRCVYVAGTWFAELYRDARLVARKASDSRADAIARLLGKGGAA